MSLDNPIFKDEERARKHLESVRWPNGPVCPHCGSTEKPHLLNGTGHRQGLYTCADCHKQFTATIGTIFERSHIPLHKWLLAFHLLSASKKGISSHQIHRMLNITYKTAWFMTHRIREAMKDPKFTSKLGGNGKIVEIDETYWGNAWRGNHKRRGMQHKEKIFSLVERGGKIRSFHVESVRGDTLKPILKEQIAQDTHVVSDDFGSYRDIDNYFLKHSTVNHEAREYSRGEIYTNTLENYFSILKRGLRGVYQHVDKKHLRRYCGEFDFRYNTRDLSDSERAILALRGIVGKRLLYTRNSLEKA